VAAVEIEVTPLTTKKAVAEEALAKPDTLGNTTGPTVMATLVRVEMVWTTVRILAQDLVKMDTLVAAAVVTPMLEPLIVP
jgi:hypothetical protein